jgi:hypothetical protein
LRGIEFGTEVAINQVIGDFRGVSVFLVYLLGKVAGEPDQILVQYHSDKAR